MVKSKATRLLTLFLLCSLLSQAQVNRDSLWSVWENESLEDSTRLLAIHNLAFNVYRVVNPDTARVLALMELNFAREIKSPLWEGRALNTIAVTYQIQSNLDSAVYYILKSIELFESQGMKQGLMYSYGNLAENYRVRSEFDKAIDYGLKSLEIARELEQMDAVGQLLANMGGAYWQMGDYKAAIEKFNKAISIGEKYSFGSLLPNAYTGLGNVYAELGHYQEAIDSYEKSIAYCEELDDQFQKINPLNNIGEIYLRMGKWERSISFYAQSLEISEKLDIRSGIAMTTNALANVLMLQGNHESAMEYLERSIDISTEIGEKSYLISALNNRARLELELGQYSDAQKTAEQSFSLAKESGVLIVYRDAAEGLYEVYKALGRYQQALEMNELFLTLNDSVINKENDDEIFRQKYKYQYEKQALADSLAQNEEKLKLELAHQEELHAETRTRNYLIGAGALLLLLAGGGWSRLQFVRKKNAELKEARDKAEESERFKQRFLANMSHEIRTPMNAVLGLTQLTLDTELTDKQRNYLEAVHHSSENLLVIVNDILDLSKLEQGKLEFEKIPFRLKEQVEQVYQTLKFKAEEKGLEFNVKVAENIPHRVLGDPSRLIQVLMNLTSNAIKFTKEGSVTIEVEKGESEQIRFAVKDTGIGIPADKQDQLFESFRQLDESTSRKYGGTGLGLAISKDLVELQGGKISVKSKLYEGSVFSFVLNMPEAQVDAALSKELTVESLKGIRVLVAEDNPYNQIVVQDTLENLIEGVRVTVVKNGELAISELDKELYDIILMDAHMPIMDGVAATKVLREKGNEIPIIALTASVLNEEIDRCIEAGMNDSLPKPFKREDLVNVLGKFYQKRN